MVGIGFLEVHMEAQKEAIISGVEGQGGKRLQNPGEGSVVHRNLGLAQQW